MNNCTCIVYIHHSFVYSNEIMAEPDELEDVELHYLRERALNSRQQQQLDVRKNTCSSFILIYMYMFISISVV